MRKKTFLKEKRNLVHILKSWPFPEWRETSLGDRLLSSIPSFSLPSEQVFLFFSKEDDTSDESGHVFFSSSVSFPRTQFFLSITCCCSLGALLFAQIADRHLRGNGNRCRNRLLRLLVVSFSSSRVSCPLAQDVFYRLPYITGGSQLDKGTFRRVPRK